MEDILNMVTVNIRADIASAPELRDADWDESFAERAKYFRTMVEDLVAVDDAIYAGTVGDHSFSLGPVAIHGDDGYRRLLVDWCAAAEEAIAAGKAGAA
jgi:hypothetical protein